MNSGYDDITLDELKQFNLDILAEIRQEKLNAGFPFNGHMYDSIDRERMNIIGASTLALALMMQGKDFPANFTWRTQENVNVPYTAQQVIQLGTAMFTFISTCYQVSWAHKANINAFTEDQFVDLQNYDLTTGWPT